MSAYAGQKWLQSPTDRLPDSYTKGTAEHNGKQQKYRNDGKRERKGYEKGHAVLLIQFIHNHDEIDVTERYETDGKNPEHMIALGYHFRTVCPESPGNHSRERQISRQVTAIETVIKRKDFLRIKLKA